MRKRNWKTTMTCLLVAAMLISTTGCNADISSRGTADERNTEEHHAFYQAEVVPLTGYEGVLSKVNCDGDKILLSSSDMTEEEEMMAHYRKSSVVIDRCYVVENDGEKLNEITLPELEKEDQLKELFVDGEKGYVGIVMGEDSARKSQIHMIKFDLDGTITVKENLSKQVKEAYKAGEQLKCVKDSKDNLILTYGKVCTIYDANGTLICEKQMEDTSEILGACELSDGRIGVFCSVAKDGDYASEMMAYDGDQKEWTEAYSLPFVIEELYKGFDSYSFVYSNENGLYGYDMESGVGAVLINYMQCGLQQLERTGFCEAEHGVFYGLSCDNEGVIQGIGKYTQTDDETSKKKILTVCAAFPTETIQKDIIAFNRTHDDVSLVLNDYSEVGMDYATIMSADIMTGMAGDIICLMGMDPVQYAQKGVLEDLTPYFEKDDSVDLQDMVDPLREACMQDGKLYFAPKGFDVFSIMAPKEDVGERSGWNTEEFLGVVNKLNPETELFNDNTKINMLNRIISHTIEDYIDWENGTCSFDSQEFKQILEVCNRGENSMSEEEQDGFSDFSDNRNPYFELIEGGFCSTLSFDEKLKDKRVVGYPNKDKNGHVFYLHNTYGILTNSENKDLAWEFIQMIMDSEYQGKNVSSETENWILPSRKDALELQEHIFTTTDSFTDAYGKEHKVIGTEDVSARKPVSKEAMEEYRKLLAQTTQIYSFDYSIANILNEEAQAYFSGDKTVEEVAKIIQNRMETYVSENR